MARTYKYQKIKSSVAKQSVEELVNDFNSLVGSLAWTSARAAHDKALIEALIKNGVDVSAVYDGTTISFKNKIILSEDGKKLIIEE